MDRTAIIQALARISRKRLGDISNNASLSSLGVSSSLGLSLLRSNLEALSGKVLSTIDGHTRVGELVSLILNGSASPGDESVRAEASEPDPVSPPSRAELPPSRAEMGLGLDIQDVDSMPLTSDYRTHEFYRDHFTPSEIATALLRSDPRLHLCGIFCAKEAAKKSHPALLQTRMSELIVTHDPAGKPLLGLFGGNGTPRQRDFQFILSISHTAKFAVAACITTW
jgi:holo-[acyl-carrier protein] synthase